MSSSLRAGLALLQARGLGGVQRLEASGEVPPPVRTWPCRRCGVASANRFYCPECHAIVSDGVSDLEPASCGVAAMRQGALPGLGIVFDDLASPASPASPTNAANAADLATSGPAGDAA